MGTFKYNCPNCQEAMLFDDQRENKPTLCPKCASEIKPEKNKPLDPFREYANAMPRIRTVYVLLGLFLGYLGIHNFYGGYIIEGCLQILASLLLLFMPASDFKLLCLIVMAAWILGNIFFRKKDSRGLLMLWL
jgi:TM2 domain-containing membrane protein YozV/DNA-directed RNA polymerase subunit RPC12/RpoP